MLWGFIFAGILGTLLCAYLLGHFFRHYLHEKIGRISRTVALFGLVYGGLALFSFLWGFSLLPFSLMEFFAVFAVFAVLQTLLFFRLVFLFSRSRHLFYYGVLYLCLLPLLFVSLHYASFFVSLLSYLLSLLLFSSFLSQRPSFHLLGYLGIGYSALSIAFLLAVFFSSFSASLFLVFSSLFLLVLFSLLLSDLSEKAPSRRSSSPSSSPYFLTFVQYFVFVLTITNFVFIGTIAIHEFGHYALSQYYGCEHARVIFDSNFPRTEVLCSQDEFAPFITWAGILLPLGVAALLFFVGGVFMREIAFLVVGFNLLASHHDLLSLGVSEGLSLAVVFLGAISFFSGIVGLILSRTEGPFFFGN